MTGKIEQLKIEELHGHRNITVNFIDNILILVGENGAGKTTILRILYCILSGEYTQIAQLSFKKITLIVDGKEYTLEYSGIKSDFEKKVKRISRRLLPFRFQRYKAILDQLEPHTTREDVNRICIEYGVPVSFYKSIIEELYLETPELAMSAGISLPEVKVLLNSQILYLPTYRRIEQDLRYIFKNIDGDEQSIRRRELLINEKRERGDSYLEIVEFGMNDVKSAIDTTIRELRSFTHKILHELTLGYLGEVVDQKYLEINASGIGIMTDEQINNVLNRIEEPILSESQKERVFNTIRSVIDGNTGSVDLHNQFICHFFLKLLNFQKELQEKERQINRFCEVCNKYMVGKQFSYDSNSFTLDIKQDKVGGSLIDLQHLSSGEKQIASLFSHLYLSTNNRYFVIIDEPELSLSVPWQKQFLLDIKNGVFCSGIVAATHSPFIYDNELKRYAHGINEFEV